MIPLTLPVEDEGGQASSNHHCLVDLSCEGRPVFPDEDHGEGLDLSFVGLLAVGPQGAVPMAGLEGLDMLSSSEK